MHKSCNKPDAANPAIALLFHAERHRRGVADPERSAGPYVMRIRTLPLCIGSAAGSGALLGAGWLWARLLISAYQRQEGIPGLTSSLRAAHYHFWGIWVPSAVTANVLVFLGVLSLFALWQRRDHFAFLALSAYFAVLAGACVFLFAGLDFAAFD